MSLQVRPALVPRRRPSALAPGRTLGDVVEALAAEHRTGAVQSTTGVVHLAEGEVLQVQSAAAPDLPTLLVRSGRLTEQDLLELSGTPREPLFEALLSSGRIGRGVLELCHLSAMSDAAFLALPQDSGPVRFQQGAHPQLGAIRPIDVRTLRAAVAQRRALLDRIWPCPWLDTAPVRLSANTEARTDTGWSRGQRAVVRVADGRRTPLVIARLLGRPAFATLLDVRRLAAAGLVETPPDRAGPAVVAAPVRSPVPAALAAPTALSAELSLGAGESAHGPAVPADPEVALLIRLRAALEARL
ncbi:transcriptional regulator [Kitasatospora sp. GP82]|uniref:transcriptional regulator n=1 Tax=Kitasatospora sp. GP82 TaxID=3035089 RepID=UPI00247598F7|nr:transcriptional regulator [Kitasatospora sp. GP82]MDH6126416.1 hypothetical protein [Kitasatospora sp. GP82]